jgi:hypothetical protein
MSPFPSYRRPMPFDQGGQSKQQGSCLQFLFSPLATLLQLMGQNSQWHFLPARDVRASFLPVFDYSQLLTQQQDLDVFLILTHPFGHLAVRRSTRQAKKHVITA